MFTRFAGIQPASKSLVEVKVEIAVAVKVYV